MPPPPQPEPPPWAAERDLGADRTRALVEAACPDLAPLRLEPLGTGWDNAAWLAVGRDAVERVFRFPRRALAARLLATETALLPALAPHLPLPVPVPDRRGVDGGEPPWPFAGYPHLAGRPACSVPLEAAERARLAEPLARFLAALHAFPAARARALGAPGDELDRLAVVARTPALLERLARARRAGVAADGRVVEAVIAATPTAFAPRTTTLVHGDLYARHVLLDERRRPCGVIDWGDVHVGEPAVDLALAPLLLPPAAQERFRATYGAIGEDAWCVARWRALHHAAAVIDYGLAAGDPALVGAGRAALAHLDG